MSGKKNCPAFPIDCLLVSYEREEGKKKISERSHGEKRLPQGGDNHPQERSFEKESFEILIGDLSRAREKVQDATEECRPSGRST